MNSKREARSPPATSDEHRKKKAKAGGAHPERMKNATVHKTTSLNTDEVDNGQDNDTDNSNGTTIPNSSQPQMTVKRGRGRPPKLPVAVAASISSSPLKEIKKRGPGRPTKVAKDLLVEATEDDEDIDTLKEIKKRGPGRPTKVAKDLLVEATEVDEDIDMDGGNEPRARSTRKRHKSGSRQSLSVEKKVTKDLYIQSSNDEENDGGHVHPLSHRSKGDANDRKSTSEQPKEKVTREVSNESSDVEDDSDESIEPAPRKPKRKGKGKKGPGRPKGSIKKVVDSSPGSPHSDSDNYDETKEGDKFTNWRQHPFKVGKDRSGDGWCSTDEDELHDEVDEVIRKLVNKSTPEEAALWNKCWNLYTLPPSNILPASVQVCVTKRKDMEGDEFETQLWSSDFCKVLGTIICCPIFKDRLDFFKYVIEYALALRVTARNGRPRPSKSMLSADVNERVDRLISIMGIMADELHEDLTSVIKNVIIKPVLLDDMGPGLPEHFGFVKHLKKFVKKGKDVGIENGNQLTIGDLRAIVSAWDDYANNERKKLPTMQLYLKTYSQENPTSGKARRGHMSFDDWFKGVKTEYLFLWKVDRVRTARRRARKSEMKKPVEEEMASGEDENQIEKHNSLSEGGQAASNDNSSAVKKLPRTRSSSRHDSNEEVIQESQNLDTDGKLLDDPLSPLEYDNFGQGSGSPILGSSTPAREALAVPKSTAIENSPAKTKSHETTSGINRKTPEKKGHSLSDTVRNGKSANPAAVPVPSAFTYHSTLTAFSKCADDAGLSRRTQIGELPTETENGFDYDRRPGTTLTWKSLRQTRDEFLQLKDHEDIIDNQTAWNEKRTVA